MRNLIFWSMESGRDRPQASIGYAEQLHEIPTGKKFMEKLKGFRNNLPKEMRDKLFHRHGPVSQLQDILDEQFEAVVAIYKVFTVFYPLVHRSRSGGRSYLYGIYSTLAPSASKCVEGLVCLDSRNASMHIVHRFLLVHRSLVLAVVATYTVFTVLYPLVHRSRGRSVARASKPKCIEVHRI